MTKHLWMLWLVPVACWAVYMCWLTGYQNGYAAGHTDGWNTARRVIDNGVVHLAEMERPH
uniref:Uncharacterized protein n=1 Tax=Schlesneria paludicola TaxID=360056 RepID=A0A7C2JZJ5_9PLAN